MLRICHTQGSALDEVLAFFPAVLASGSSAVTFDSMLSSLLAAGNGQDTSKTAQHNIARCIASLTAPTSQQQVNAVVKGLLTQLQVCSSLDAKLRQWTLPPCNSLLFPLWLSCLQ